MLLIADSGSTKTEWRLLVPHQPTQVILGTGINPFYQSDAEITQILGKEVASFQNLSIQEIHFYGAGCQNASKKQRVKNALQTVFQRVNSENIFVETDLLASARSLAGTQKGLIGILGTGTNVNFYDGQAFPNYQSSLGFLLGDEGSGADLGRELVKAFLRHEMPIHLQDKFRRKYDLQPHELIQNVYQASFPNRYLAGLTHFLSENKSDEFIQDLLTKRFNLFFQKIVLKQENYQDYPLFMMGSIAFHFQEELLRVAESYAIKIEKIIKAPSEDLEVYYQQKLKN